MKDRQKKRGGIKYYLVVLAVVLAAIIGGADSGTIAYILREAGSIIQSADTGVSDDGNEGERTEEGEIQPLIVTFIDVGQGDSILLQCGGHNMLIDAGKNDQGTKLQAYFNSKKIESFDYLVGTHPDEDHIGGLDVIITKFQASHVLMPDRKADTKTYDDVILAMKYKSVSPENPKPGDSFSLGDARITVLGPPEKKYGNNNNYSIVLMVRHGNKKFLFTGDAEEEEEMDILESGADVDADVLKAGHHGSKSSSCQEFLNAVSPDAAVISCGEDNKYGHPHAETMNNLRIMGVDVYRTDREGAIVIESDGDNLTFNVPPSEW